MFNFQSAKSGGWVQALRGGQSLAAVLLATKSTSSSSPSSSSPSSTSSPVVQEPPLVCPGHVALLLHGGSTLCLFDTVPAARQLTDPEERALTHALLQPPSASSSSPSSTSSATSPGEVSLLRIQRVVLLSHHASSPIISVWFDSSPSSSSSSSSAMPQLSMSSGASGAGGATASAAGNVLRLLAVQADGRLHAWRWNAASWRWSPYEPGLLPPSRDPRSFGVAPGRPVPARRVTRVTASPLLASSSSSSSAGRVVFWCEKYVRNAAASSAPQENGKQGSSEQGDGSSAKPKKKSKEYLRLCWTDLSFDEAVRAAPAAQPTIMSKQASAHDDDDDDDDASVRLGKANLIDTIEGDVHSIFSSNEGTWIMNPTSLYLWSYHTRTLYSCPLSFTNRLKSGREEALQDSDTGPKSEEIVAATIHSITGELLLLNSIGKVLVCSLVEDEAHTPSSAESSGPLGESIPSTSASLRRVKAKLRIRPICTCQGLIGNRKQEEEVVDFFAHRHVVGVVTASAVRLFDLVRGFFVEEVPLPKPIVLDGGVRRRFFPSSAGVASSGLWRIGGLGLSAANIGVWSADGLWTLQYPRVTKQAEFLIKTGVQTSTVKPTDSPLRNAALLCKDWGMDRWYTKYLFDQATRSRDVIKAAEKERRDSEKGKEGPTDNGVTPLADDNDRLTEKELALLRNSCDDLSPFLENPALIIGLLSSASSSNRGAINKQLSSFLEKAGHYRPISTEGEQSATNSQTDKRAYSIEFTEAERDNQRRAFHYSTPLNRRLLPILQHYFKLSQKLDQQNNTVDSPLKPSDSFDPSALESSILSISTSTSSSQLSRASPSTSTTSRSSFSISSPSSPAAMRRSMLSQVDSIDRLRQVTRGDLELAEKECPEVLLQTLLRLFLPKFELEVEKYQRGRTNNTFVRSRLGEKRHHAASQFTPPHQELLQSATDESTWSARSAYGSGYVATTSGMKRSESFAPNRLNEGIGAGTGEGEEDDVTAELILSTSTNGDGNAKRGRKRADRSGDEHPFFAMLCRVLYTTRPDLLTPFLKLVASTSHPASQLAPPSAISPSTSSPSLKNLRRAWNALPPFPYHLHAGGHTASQDAQERELFTKQLQARVWLLCRIGQSPNALRLVLFLGRWDEALQIMNKRIRQPSDEQEWSEDELKQQRLEHYELFHVLLMHCFEKRDSEKLRTCWDFLPRTYSVFDILRMAKGSLSSIPPSSSYSSIFSDDREDAIVDTESVAAIAAESGKNASTSSGSSSSSVPTITNKSFTVEDLRPQLIKMYYRMKAQQEERQAHDPARLAQREAEALEEQRRQELEALRKQDRLIVVTPSSRLDKAKEKAGDELEPPVFLTPTSTPTISRGGSSVARRVKSEDKTLSKKEKLRKDFISIFDVVNK